MRTALALIVAIPWAIAAQPSAGRLPPASVGVSPATVSGFVYDSINGRPLAGALVQVVGVGDSLVGRRFGATSDSVGKYVIGAVVPGRYEVGFFHIALDTLGIAAATRLLEIGAGLAHLDLATPSSATLIKSLCAPNADSASTGLLLGHVRSAATEAFLANASVSVTWAEWSQEGGVVRQEIRSAAAVTRENGWFAICRVPSDVALHVRAGHAADSSGRVAFFVPSDSVRHISLYVGESQATAILTGTARDSAGRPVPNALATVLETNREARSNTRGAFVLDSLPGGTHMLEVTALGFTPHAAIVHLAAGQRTVADVVLSRLPIALAAVKVIARYDRNLAQFERHRTRSFGGHFMKPEEIERRPGASVGMLVRGLPGVIVRYIPREGYQVRMRRGATYLVRGIEECTPTLYIDGNKSFLGMEYVETLFRSEDIAAIEVYSRPVERPIEFKEMFDTCGAIAIWTKPFESKVKKRGP